jgi:lipid II:glycine glycyltransferase (peptidoglycan interpeptide bridge formation enzyme)
MSFWAGPHLLQTEPWGRLKAQFGWQAERVDDTLLLFRRLPLGLSLAYVPRGPQTLGTDPAAATTLLARLDDAARRRRAVLLKVEPDLPDLPAHAQTLAGLGFRPSPQTVQPRRSIVLDVAGTEDDVLARMKQKTRYNLRLAGKKGVTTRPAATPADLAAFTDLMRLTGERDRFGVHAPAYYRAAFELFHPLGQCALILAEWEGRLLAGVMAFALPAPGLRPGAAQVGGRAWYFYGASSDQERQRMAPYLAQWEAIRWARAQGARWYDLWGVPDEDEPALEAQFESRQDGLWGVYRFKRGWGGQLVRSIGAWDRVYNPALYAAYRLYLRARAGSAGLG